MIETTSQYTKLMNEIIRAPTEADVELHLVNSEITERATFSVTGSIENFSTSLTTPSKCDYITLENDWFKADGSQYILPANSQDVLPNGLVGQIAQSCQIEITFSEAVSLSGISIHLQDVSPTSSDYVDFEIRTYKNNVLKNDISKELHNDWEILDDIASDVDKILINLSAENSTGDSALSRRLRVKEIVLGQVLQIKPEQIISVRHDIKRSYLSTELYSNQVDLVMYDEDKTFNPDNPDGLWDLLRENEILKIYYSIENNRFLRNTLYLSDKKSLNDTRLQLTAVSPLQLLTDVYYETVSQSHDASYLETQLKKDTGFDISIELPNLFYFQNPLPPLPKNQCLQLIANASCGRLFVDEYGKIIISQAIPVNVNSDISFSEMFEKPTLDIKTQLRNVIVSVTTYGEVQGSETIFDSDWITVTDGYTINVKSDDSGVINFILLRDESSTVVIDHLNTTKSLYGAHIELVGNGACELVVNMAKYPKNVEYITYPVNDEGEDCTIDNPLISGKSQAYRVAEWVANYYQNTKVYETSIRQNYALETGDVVNFKNNMNDTIPALVERLQFNTPGQTGAIEVRRWDNGLDNT